jgi:glycosyltransferase involved in cell wall biosynthesis
MKVVLVDPSLYTAPYDAALTAGLVAAGVEPTWMTRPLREGDRQEIPVERTDAFFYRHADRAPEFLRPLLKGAAHLAGTVRLLAKIRRLKPAVVHVQWVVVPLIDVAAMALIRRWCALVVTVHDTVAFNGQRMSALQHWGHELPTRLADRVIVHTDAGRRALLRHGIPEHRVAVIPHGPLALPVPAPTPRRRSRRDARWTMVLFGEIKPYKGLDVLVEAVAALPPALRKKLRIVVAGRPRMDLAPIVARIAELRVAAQFDLRPGRLTEEEMAALFAEADGFVFPYRQIDASGVYYLVKPLGKWLLASRVGIFAEDMDEAQGALVPPGDAKALAQALERAIVERPRGSVRVDSPSWSEIGLATRILYEQARAEFDAVPSSEAALG